jgi:glycosyltransferase involved in cell wall biosynthesis
MKIAIDAHSIGTQAGGNETYFRELLRGLALDNSDHQYTVFHVDSADLQGITADPRFTTVAIPRNPIPRMCLSLPRWLRKIRPDVFHCQYVEPLFNPAKTVVTIHDLAHEHHPEFFHPLQAARMKVMVRAAAQRASHILTVSEFCAADIERRCGVPREKITISYQAPAEVFRPRVKQYCQERLRENYGLNEPFILYVGRIQGRKNLPRLVEAYAQLRKQGRKEKLVLAGKQDWQSEQVKAKIKELQLEDSVVFPGYVEQDDLPLLFNAAEVFVFPSIFEGFGLPVVESMASGVPTITSFGSSLQEVAGNGALLVDPLNVQSIADGIERVLSDQPLRQDLVQRGLRRSAEFTLPNFIKSILRVYRQL